MHTWALSEAVFLAKALGQDIEMERWRKSFEEAKDALNQFWDEARGVYIDSGGNAPRHAQFLAILSGAVDTERIKRLAEALISSDGGLAGEVGTPYMKYFELKALSLSGKRAEMLKEIRRYWGGMLTYGAATFWEAFVPGESHKECLAMYGRPFARSLCHAWSTGAAALLSGDLVGLRSQGLGWEGFSYEKELPKDIGVDHLYIGIPTPKGTIKIEADGGIATASQG
jgi:hypothetical protein